MPSPRGPTMPTRLAITVALVMGASISLASPAFARVPTHIACVGDSITYGYGDDVPDGGTPRGPYPAQLGELLSDETPPVNVQNFGRDGATLLSTGDTPYIEQAEYAEATTFVAQAGSNAIVDVVIMLGTNDSKPFNWDGGAHSSAFTAQYAALIQHFAMLPTKPAVFVMLPPAVFSSLGMIDGPVLRDDIDPLIEAVARGQSAPLIDLYTPMAATPALFGDGVHPTDAGYTLVAHIVESALLAPGAPSGGASSSGGCSSAGAGPEDAGSFTAFLGAQLLLHRLRRRSARRRPRRTSRNPRILAEEWSHGSIRGLGSA